MEKCMRLLRRLLLIILIVLAAFGIGMAGGVPVASSHKREDGPEIKIEAEKEEREEEQEADVSKD